MTTDSSSSSCSKRGLFSNGSGDRAMLFGNTHQIITPICLTPFLSSTRTI
jgi:hypothetical protein